MARPLNRSFLRPPARRSCLLLCHSPVYQMAEKNSPMLQRDQRVIERGQLAVAAAKRSLRPDLGCVGFMYQQRPNMPDMKGATFTRRHSGLLPRQAAAGGCSRLRKRSSPRRKAAKTG